MSATGRMVQPMVIGNNDGDEFDTGEAGGEFLVVPDNTDPTEEGIGRTRCIGGT